MLSDLLFPGQLPRLVPARKRILTDLLTATEGKTMNSNEETQVETEAAYKLLNMNPAR